MSSRNYIKIYGKKGTFWSRYVTLKRLEQLQDLKLIYLDDDHNYRFVEDEEVFVTEVTKE